MARRCTYEYHKSGIHYLNLHESSERAVDQLISYLDRICTTEDNPHLLIDFSQSGLPPVNYFMSKVMEWQQARPFACAGRKAILYSGTAMTCSLLENIGQLLEFFNPGSTQFFQKQYATDATQWLQGKAAPARSA